MASLDADLKDVGCREIVSCYDIPMPLDHVSRNPRKILEDMLHAFHATGSDPTKVVVIPMSLSPSSEAYKRNMPFAIYLAS